MKIIVTFLITAFFTVPLYAQNDIIIITGDYNYPPFSFIDKDGNPAGYDVEVMNEIAKITGLKISFHLTKWDSALNQMETGRANAIMGIVYSAEREKKYDFSFPLHTEYYGIFAKKESKIKDINDLEGKKPAILIGDISNDLFYKPMGLYKNFIATLSFPQAFSMLNSNVCDYVVAPYSLGMGVIKEEGYNEIGVKGEPIIPSVFCYAVKQGDYELLAWINQGIEILSRNGKLDTIYKKWVKYQRRDDQYKTFFYYALIGLAIFAGIILILLLFWYSLRNQVRKKTLEIKKSEVIYQNVFNAVDDGLIILNEWGKVIEANKKAYEIFGFDGTNLFDEKIETLASNKNVKNTSQILEAIKSGQAIDDEDIEIKQGDKVVHLVISGFSIDIGHKERYLIVFHDVTKDRNNYYELQKAKQNVDLANKAKGTFLSTVSHEIRTPLFAVIGYTSLLKKTALNAEQREFSKKIEISGKLLLNLVNDILDLNKMEAEKFKLINKPFQLRKMVEEVCELESLKTSEKNISFRYTVDKKVPAFVKGDRLLISRVLLNILNNALKFTHKGEVCLLVNIENPELLKENRIINVVFSIKDTGIGMTESTLQKLFNPFEQAEGSNVRKYGGTGLGLAITKQLVDLMGGVINVESTSNVGSIFNISIPMEISAEPAALNVSNNPGFMLEEPINVLLVEDNEFNAEILVSELEGAKFKVSHAKSGFESIEILKTNDFQIILMDIEMPDMDGFATTKKIHELNLSDAPVIALSAHNQTLEREKAIETGMVDYLNKPISITELSAAIYKYRKNTNQTVDNPALSIDKEKGLALFENDHEKYQRALARFKKHFEKSAEELYGLFDNHKDVLKDKTHNIKSAAKTIGAIHLSEIAANCETILRNQPDAFTNKDLVRLINELRKVLGEIL